MFALAAIPTLFFVAADVFGGHLLLSGDNLIQNYPLHVLVGRDLAHGALPLWDPWIWSGTPLLAELNPSAFYPTTLLFAVLQPHLAWIVEEVFVFASTGIGTCLLFADSGMRPVAAFLGAFVFAFGGAVITQGSGHADMADGLATLPWALLAVRRTVTDGRWRWAVLFGAAASLIILSGSPEATVDSAALILVYGIVRCSVHKGAWRRFLTRCGAGGLFAVGVTAAVWLPALHFLSASQRMTHLQSFATTKAFPPAEGLLGLVPYLLGGSTLFGGASGGAYFGPSYLGEIGFYLGILPVIAVISMWRPAWRRYLPKGEQRCWYTVLALGVVLAIGAGTPLEHLLQHIPIYGGLRNSGRNIVDVDLAAAALFGWWVDGGSQPLSSRLRFESALAIVPVLAIAGIGLWFASAPDSLWHFLGAHPAARSAPRNANIGCAIGTAEGLATLAALLVSQRHRLPRRAFMGAIVVLSAVDLAIFATGTGFAVTQALPPKSTPVESLVSSHLSTGGRYAVIDPDLFWLNGVVDGGEPDLNVLDELPSVSGYGAIVDRRYAALTGAHTRANLDLNRSTEQYGLFDPLGLQVLVTMPESFLIPVSGLPGAGKPVRVIEVRAGSDPALRGGNIFRYGMKPSPFSELGPDSGLTRGSQAGWFFGSPLKLSKLVLSLSSPSHGQLVRTGLVRPSGSIDWQHPERLGHSAMVTLSFVHATTAVAVVVRLVAGVDLPPIRVAISAGAYSYLVAGLLTHAVQPGAWRYVGSINGVVVFQSIFDPKRAWVQPTAIPERKDGRIADVSSTTKAGSAEVLTRSYETGTARRVGGSSDGSAITFDVHAAKAGLLVWSSGWNAGWQAEESSRGHAAHAVAVRRVGLVMGAAVPAGFSVVSFSYRPAGWNLGVLISLATILLLLLALLATAAWLRRDTLLRSRIAILGRHGDRSRRWRPHAGDPFHLAGRQAESERRRTASSTRAESVEKEGEFSGGGGVSLPPLDALLRDVVPPSPPTEHEPPADVMLGT